MMRRTLTLRIGYSEAIPAYERNLLDYLMKPVCFDVFEYIVDEYIQFVIESVAQEKFYKDVHHDSLQPAVPKDLRASRASSSAAPSRTTAPAPNSGILKMLQGIFAT
jgi:hypothetical protein